MAGRGDGNPERRMGRTSEGESLHLGHQENLRLSWVFKPDVCSLEKKGKAKDRKQEALMPWAE